MPETALRHSIDFGLTVFVLQKNNMIIIANISLIEYAIIWFIYITDDDEDKIASYHMTIIISYSFLFHIFAQQQATNESEGRPLRIVKGNLHLWRCVALVNTLNISLSVYLLSCYYHYNSFYLSF